MSKIVVTGAGGRLGRLIVERLMREGHSVAPVLRGADAGTARRKEPRAYYADLSDASSVGACFDEVASVLGGIDGLIHAVGTWARTPLDASSPDAWEHLVRVNLFTTHLCFREIVKHMAGGGTLIAFASAQGADRGIGGQSAYAAAKAGVIRLVESAAAELAPKNVRAHAIAPSTILFRGDAGAGVTADELIDLCLYLLSPAGHALNGQLLRAYGTGR